MVSGGDPMYDPEDTDVTNIEGPTQEDIEEVEVDITIHGSDFPNNDICHVLIGNLEFHAYVSTLRLLREVLEELDLPDPDFDPGDPDPSEF
jgi:hypothetical protein